MEFEGDKSRSYTCLGLLNGQLLRQGLGQLNMLFNDVLSSLSLDIKKEKIKNIS